MGRLARIPIRLRLTLAFALAMAVVLAATGLFLYLRLASALDRTIDHSLQARAGDVAALVRRDDSYGAEGGEITQVLDRRGSVLAGLDQPLLTRDEVARAPLTVERRVPGDDEAARLLAMPVDTARGARIVLVGMSLEQRGDALENLLVALLVGGPLALLVASLAGYALAAAALRPVEAMRGEADAVSASEPGRRLTLPPPDDEIRRLGQTLNGMLTRLESALERERRFVADASHELRTPLAALRAELELALARERTRPELEAAIRSASEETDRLCSLADDLLVLARSEEGKLPVRPERMRAADLLGSIVRRFEHRAAQAGRPLVLGDVDGLEVYVDRLRAEQAVGNLVENALSHGGGTVTLEARPSNGLVELHVRDEGRGFDDAFLDRAFEPFSRGDAARSGGGAGLGLAIVDVVARAHGGAARAETTDDGADVWLELPDPR